MNDTPAGSAALLSELIGLVYEAASDLSLWPRLLEGMADYLGGLDDLPANALADPAGTVAAWFGDGGQPPPVALPEAERFLFACLAPHFVRAQRLHRQLAEAEDERNLLEGVMDRLPLGMAIVDTAAAAVTINRPMLNLVRGGGPLRLEAGRLASQPREALAEALHSVLHGRNRDATLRLGHADHGPVVSLWISRLAQPERIGTETGKAIVLAASQQARALSESALTALFGLSPAEARLTQQLALGQTVEEAARAQGISINTAKTQLKRVFAKVGVRRQPELVQAIYASPLWLDLGLPDGGEPLRLQAAEMTRRPEEEGSLLLADGRRLCWSDCGDPDGLPVIFMHGIAGSRYLRHPDDGLLLAAGIRLLIPERPGSGDSDPQAGRRISDWPDDVAALADHLGLTRFAVLGYSAGTPYALAVAQAMPARVAAVSIVAAMPPIGSLDDLRQYAPTFRMSLLVARHTPSLLPPLIRIMAKGIRSGVYRYIEQTLADATESDRQIFADPRLRANYATGLLAGCKRGESDLALEVLLAAGDWGFAQAPLPMPLQFWHGDADTLVAPAGSRKLAALYPGAQLTEVAGGGHYIIYSHWREILEKLRAAAA